MTTSRKTKAATAADPSEQPQTTEQTVESAPPVEYFHFHIRPELLVSDENPDGLARVAVGHAPRVSIAAGATYTTTDPREAKRLRRCDELEETRS